VFVRGKAITLILNIKLKIQKDFALWILTKLSSDKDNKEIREKPMLILNKLYST